MMKVLVVGSGISGLSAAVESADRGQEVILLSPYISERSQSVMAAGGINAAFDTLGENDSTECHAMDTIKGGCFIENEENIRAFCEKAPENVRWLEKLGVVFSRDKNDNICLRAFGGQSHRRTAYAGTSTGKQIVTALNQKCREFEIKGKITRKTNLWFHSAFIDNGICYGIIAVNSLSGETEAIFADAVIMAVGGQNKLFGKTTGSELCDGYAAGKLFSQGVRLRNLEFIQYHPTSIETAHKHMLISEAARGEGGRLYYIKNGERCYFMEEKYGHKGNLMPRDIVSKCVYDCPGQVYLDITFLGEKLIKERLKEIYDLCLEYIGVDVTKESIPIEPSVHFFMGGVDVDNHHQTNIKRLYAVGECASKYHGANRLGGNSLLAAVHSGRVAAEDCLKIENNNLKDPEKLFENYISGIRSSISDIAKSKSLYPAKYIEKEIAAVMNKDLGITRNEEGLKSGIESINFYLKVLEKLQFDSTVSVYENFRLYSMALLAKAVLMSALERKETRGAHIRSDFPETNEQYQKCSVAEYKNGEIIISYRKENDIES